MPSINNLVATTELDAVNAMLAAIGEAPVADIATAQADAPVAVQLLKECAREVQSWGWRFNTEFELQKASAATLSWTDPDGTVTALYVFTPPADTAGRGLASVKLSKRYDQIQLDNCVTIAPSKVYSGGGTLVFYDRARNRDGFPQSERTYLYLDVTWLFDFEKMPEEARRYIAMRAARQLAYKQFGDADRAQWTQADESAAFLALNRAHGNKDDLNIFDSGDTLGALGGRPRYLPTVNSARRYWRR